MGKKIDKVTGLLLGTLCCHVYYMAMTKNLWISLLLTFLTMLAVRRVIKTLLRLLKKAGRKNARTRRASARLRLENWLTANEQEASGDIAHLLSLAYPDEISLAGMRPVCRRTGEYIPFEFLARRAPLGDDDVLAVWKKHRGQERVILASTAPMGSCACTAQLVSPRIILLDRHRLETLITRHLDVIVPANAAGKRRIRPILSRFTDRKKAPRYLIYGALMFAFYLLMGTHAYLAAGLVMLFLAGAGFRSAAAPERLL